MTAAEFSRLVEQPSLLRDANAADLRDLASRYPFCASVHLLLLKKYQVDKHADFDARLAQTAAYANDRKALYRLLYDESKFKQTEEAPEVGTHEQRVGTEIMLGNESGAFADYTPKNRVAEIETYETIEFNAVGEVEGLRELENENSDRISFELQEQFILANTAAGGGSEISTDFQDLEEDRDEEPLEEDQDAEIESMKILENVGSISLENGLVETDGMYNLTEVRSTNGIGKHHDFDSSVEIENEAFDSKLELAWSETSFDTTRDTPTKPSEDIPGEAVPEQQREMPADPMEHSNVEREESPSPKEQDAVEP
ncbi:MAG TPA: hypothetical protein VEY71_02105, partial [Chitinophagales bacterium]|nr:hypothetical protein [Chitinophagales bacterium]